MRVRSTEDLGAMARDRRQELGMSQAELAARADVTRQWVIRFERGAPDVSFSRAMAVLTALDLQVHADTEETRSGSGVRPAAAQFAIPNIDMPRIDFSGVDWQKVAQRLAATSIDFSASVARMRSMNAQAGGPPVAITAENQESSGD